MACEDYPCCGHELGCCPDFDEDGKQLNMKCVCTATLPLNNPSSLCDSCLRGDPNDPDFDPFEDERYCGSDDDDNMEDDDFEPDEEW